MRFLGQSTFERLLLAFLLVGAVTGGPLIYVSFHYTQNLTERLAQQQAVQQVTIIANNFMQQYGENVRRALDHSVSSDLYREYTSTSQNKRIIVRKKLENSFMRMVKAYGEYSGMYYIDPKGLVELSIEPNSRETMPGPLVDDVLDFDKNKASPTRVNMANLFRRMEKIPVLLSSGGMEWFIPPREAQTQGPFIDEKGRLSVLVGLATMDYDNGAFGGVIVIRQQLDTLESQLKSVRFFDENPVWLLDANNRALIKPDSQPIAFDPRPHLGDGRKGGIQYRKLNGGLITYAGLSIVPNQPLMRVAFAIPKTLLMKDFDETLKILLIVLLSSVAVMLMLAFVISKRIAKPIAKLANAASRLAEGDLSARVDVKTSGEIKVLVNSFNQMTANLQSADAKLKASAEDLRVALEQEMKLNKLQRQFVSMASHEFRTPLAIIDQSAQRLKRKADCLSSDYALSRVEKIRSAVQRMIRLIDSTLSAACMDEGALTIDPQPCDIGQLIADVCERMQETSTTHVIRCDQKDLPPVIMADVSALDQILTNLISNAVKYSPGSSEVDIEGFSDNTDIVIRAKDEGLGIDEDDIPKMFTRFFRARSSTGIAGTGIGLNLVKQLVEMHDGSISLESEIGKGTTFTVRLPISGPAQGQQPPSKADARPNQNNHSEKAVA